MSVSSYASYEVLLVDDHRTMLQIIQGLLMEVGFTKVDKALDGVEALKLMENKRYDIIISDWNMPNMDGLQLLKEIRLLNKEIPIIMITTEAERARVVTAIQAGVSDYLVKPFTPDSLKSKLERLTCIKKLYQPL